MYCCLAQSPNTQVQTRSHFLHCCSIVDNTRGLVSICATSSSVVIQQRGIQPRPFTPTYSLTWTNLNEELRIQLDKKWKGNVLLLLNY